MTKQRWTIHDISISEYSEPNGSKNYPRDSFGRRSVARERFMVETPPIKPESIPKDKFWIEMEFSIGHWDFQFGHGIQSEVEYFRLDVITVDYLRGYILKNGLAVPQFVVIVEDYIEQEIVDYVNILLDRCSYKDWNATDRFLSLFMASTYASHIAPDFNPPPARRN